MFNAEKIDSLNLRLGSSEAEINKIKEALGGMQLSTPPSFLSIFPLANYEFKEIAELKERIAALEKHLKITYATLPEEKKYVSTVKK